MARNVKTTQNTAVSFKIGDTAFRVLPGRSRDFLSSRSKADSSWMLMTQAEADAVIAQLEAQVARLKEEVAGN